MNMIQLDQRTTWLFSGIGNRFEIYRPAFTLPERFRKNI